MLHAKPAATPMEVLNAMRMTAGQAHSPDNLMGWGVINALAAIDYLTGRVHIPTGSFMLGDSYPNPFPTPANPSATIEFVLAEESKVTLKIFNTLGQEVRTVVNDQRTSGAFYVPWDGRNNSGLIVASGVYFYRLAASGISGRSYTDTRKLTVTR
jgi:hypothetical protein